MFGTCNVSRYLCTMINSFRHKGLKLYYEKGDASKLQPQHVGKIRLILTRLEAAALPSEMQMPGYDLHQLSGKLKDFWSVKVNGNYRIIFRFDNRNVYDVDYLDYH
jgi:proteic killer suppression protein